MSLGTKIRKLRELKGLSQENMAHELGMSQNNYSKIELGKVHLTIDRLTEIAQVLDIDPVRITEFDESVVFNNNNSTGVANNSQNGGVLNNNFGDNTLVEELVNGYKMAIEGYKTAVDALKSENEILKQEISNLRAK